VRLDPARGLPTHRIRARIHSHRKRSWVVERTIGWLVQHRRLPRDYDTLPGNSASMITIAMIDNLARRLTNETTPTWRDAETT
jgi:transposase